MRLCSTMNKTINQKAFVTLSSSTPAVPRNEPEDKKSDKNSAGESTFIVKEDKNLCQDFRRVSKDF